MNVKRKTKNKNFRNLCQSLAGIILSVSAFVFPVTVYAEAAVPQEQVYLDPSQAEAAKKQKEADAKYNSDSQINAAVAAAAKEDKKTEKAAVPQSEPDVSRPKNMMPQEQVYLDPSQIEAAKKQKEADAKYNSDSQNNAAVAAAEKKEVKEDNSVETAKPVEETKEIVKTEAAKEENKTGKAEVTQASLEASQVKDNTTQQSAEVPQPQYVMPQEQVYLDTSQIEAAKQQKADDARYNSQSQTKNVEVVTGDRVIANVKVVEQEKKEKVDGTATNAVPNEVAKEVVAKEVKTEKVNGTTTDNNSEIKNVEKEKSVTATTQQQTAIKEKTEISKVATDKVSENNTEIKHKPVRLHHFGMAKEVTTRHATVGEVLKEMKINMEGRSVYPAPETKVTDGMVIHVLARKSFLSQEEAEVPFGTQVINDPELAFGEKKVEKEGVKGKDLVIYENITRPGREQKIELDRRRVAEPVNEIVRQGVAQSVLTPEGYKRYKRKIYGEATAYTWGGGATGHTSVGLWPKRGIVAVDPRVIPYYTKLFIPGYGLAIAGDTGGAIVGTRIDLFMDSLHECFQWGRRDVEIYILE
jgi:3D (Asp-Asp-Asp) domain-containing protein